MENAEFEHWQAALPTGCNDLTDLLITLQAEWVHAHAGLLPATRLGNGDLVQHEVTTLGRQIRTVEERLLQ